MTINKAIEILDIHQADIFLTPDIDLRDAVKLGIEALWWTKTQRENSKHEALYLLPGETEE